MEIRLPYPKVIHQTWKSRHLYRPLAHCAASFCKLNPGWDYKLWTDAECINLFEEHLPDFLSTYLAYPPGVLRADIFRVAVLYVYGGVYADLDVECLRPLDSLLARAWPNGTDARVDSTGSIEVDHEVLLARDHPSHERTHYHGRPTWMNAFMVAKRQPHFFRRVLDAFTHQLGTGYNPADAVEATGPGLLTTLIEAAGNDLQALRIGQLPWHLVHPLPNVFIQFPERPAYKALITSQEWRHGRQVRLVDEDEAEFQPWMEAPFVAHYWWHGYVGNIDDVKMLLRYEDVLLQSDGQLVERRLGELPEEVLPQSLGEALSQLAENKGTNICILGRELNSSLLKILDIAGAGLGWQIAHIETPHPDAAPADLIIQDFEFATAAPLAQTALESALSERGLLLWLVEGLDHMPPEDAGLSSFRHISSYALWEHVVPESQQIPKIIHFFDAEEMQLSDWQRAARQSWLGLQQHGWQVRFWSLENLADLVAREEEDFVGAFHDYPSPAFQRDAGRWLILKHHGGLVVDPRSVCLRPLDEFLLRKGLLISTTYVNSGPHVASDEFVASSKRHPFWEGICSHLSLARHRDLALAAGGGFIDERAGSSTLFLDQRNWPQMLDKPSYASQPLGTDLLSLICQEDWYGLRCELGSRRLLPRNALFALFSDAGPTCVGLPAAIDHPPSPSNSALASPPASVPPAMAGTDCKTLKAAPADSQPEVACLTGIRFGNEPPPTHVRP